MRFLIFNITVLTALGFLFTSAPNQSFPQWAAAALDLLADRDKAQRIAGRARDWADGRFSLAAHVDAVTAIYDRLLTTP